MNKKIVISSVASAALLLPVLASAFITPAPPAGGLTLDLVFSAITTVLWVIFIGFAVIMFIVAAFQFFSAQGDPGEIGTARQSVIWGVVGIIAGVIAFSLPHIITSYFGAG